MTRTNDKWGIILNPKSGNKDSKKKEDIIGLMSQRGIGGEFRFTEYAGHAKEMVMDMVSEGYRKFIVVGGDGSVSEVVDGLMSSGVKSQELYLAIVPNGTGNDWSRYWGLSKDLDKSIETILAGKTTMIDVGKLTFFVKREQKTKFFINSVGLGYDARVVGHAEKMGQVMRGMSITYMLALMSGAVVHKSKHMSIKDQDSMELIEDHVFSMSIANGPYTGGGIKQTPDATPDDGILDLMVATKPSVKSLALGLHSILSKKYNDKGIIHYYRATEVHINSKSRHLVEADGLLQKDAKAPLDIYIIPQALNMIIP